MMMEVSSPPEYASTTRFTWFMVNHPRHLSFVLRPLISIAVRGWRIHAVVWHVCGYSHSADDAVIARRSSAWKNRARFLAALGMTRLGIFSATCRAYSARCARILFRTKPAWRAPVVA